MKIKRIIIGLVILLAFAAAFDFVNNGGHVFISYFEKFAPRLEAATFENNNETDNVMFENRAGYIHIHKNGKTETLKLEYEEISMEEPSSGIDKIYVDNTIGNIKFVNTNDDKIKIVVTKSVGVDKGEEKQAMLNKVTSIIKREGSTFLIKASSHKSVKYHNIDYKLYVPKSIKVFNAKTNTGNINTESISGTLKLHTSAGNVELSDVELEGDTEISTYAGSIIGDINMHNTKSVKISSAAGEIELTLPGDSQMNLNAETSAGNIYGDFFEENYMNKMLREVKGPFNGGGVPVTIQTHAGSIELKKK